MNVGCNYYYENNNLALEWASSRIKDDEEIVRPIVERYGPALEHVSSRLCGDYTMIMLALENTWKNSSSIPYLKVKYEQTICHVDINRLAVHLSSVPLEGTFELVSLVARHCGINDIYTLLRDMNSSLFVSSLAANEQKVRVPDRKRRRIGGN